MSRGSTTDLPETAADCAEALKPVNDYVKFVFRFLGFSDGGFICQNHCLLPEDIAQFPETLQKAKDLGRALVKQPGFF